MPWKTRTAYMMRKEFCQIAFKTSIVDLVSYVGDLILVE